MKLKVDELEFLNENEEQIKLYIGKGADNYIKKWKEGKKFNIAAFLFGIIWLGYRGMYKVILCILLILSLLDILVLFIEIDFVIFAGIIIELILGFFGNYLYFLQVKKDILIGKRPFLNGVIGIFLSSILFFSIRFVFLYSIFYKI